MRFGWGKLVVVLVTSVAILQIIHVLLLNWLDLKNDGLSQRQSDEVRHNKLVSPDELKDHYEPSSSTWKLGAASITKDLLDMVSAVQDSSVLDSSGEFRIINHLVQPDSLGYHKIYNDDVTLVTQCSHSRLSHLVDLSQHWDGPISVTIFATNGDLVDALVSVAELRQCYSAVRLNTSFHFVYPLSPHREHHLQELIKLTILKWSSKSSKDGNCKKFTLTKRFGKHDAILKEGSDLFSVPTNYDAKDGVSYPNNLLRNVARRNILTEFFFLVDVDTVPSSSLHRDFLTFADTNRLFLDLKKDDKTVYVVPAFEAKEEVLVPPTKMALLELIESMKARPFYFELCWKCQKHTDYDAWQREPITPHLKVVFEVLWKDPWEPFYIARNSVPFYDERFKQYGFNRISQVCELHVAGYRFSVLNNAFLIHFGLKTLDSFHKRKDEDQERNRLLFRQFKSELKEKYPDSSRRCY